MPAQQVQNNTLLQFNQFVALNRPESSPNAISPSATPIMFRSQCTTLAPQLQSNMLPPTPISCPSTHTLSMQNVGFPNPCPGQLMIYLLQFCPVQTSMCFGCGNPLNQTDGIPAPPNDLVVVSRMLREWTFQGQARSKLGNVQPRTQGLSYGKTLVSAGHVMACKFSSHVGVSKLHNY